MSIDTETTVAPEATQLTAEFTDAFFGRNSTVPETTNSEDSPEATPEDDANLEQDTQVEDDTLAPDEGTEDTTEEVSDDTPEEAPKKNRAQERIEELNAKFRQEQREKQELLARLEKLEKATTQTQEPEPPVAPTSDEFTPIDPFTKNEDGTDKYPLGIYDPKYISDNTRAVFQHEKEQAAKAEAAKAQEEAVRQAQDSLQADWNTRVITAQERYPDYVEKGQGLIDSFSDIDKSYGEYLSNTIMQLDNGTDVFYYLAEHPEEARAIVNSGALKATIALGRIDARFEKKQEEAPQKIVSQAPEPPSFTNKGTASAVNKGFDEAVYDDAFRKRFFQR